MGVIERSAITGLVLAGGRGTRMGGLDKGLQAFRSVPLARHAALRLAPQVGRVAINANRHVATYEQWGWPVWTDSDPGDFHGPLAGMLAGATQAETDWLVTVPCDAPSLPQDLVERLVAAATKADARVALAASVSDDGRVRRQPTFCLMHCSLRDALKRHVDGGGRKVMDWLASQGAAEARFEGEAAFFNANTLDDLTRGEQA
jgi:molybdenum cofactor guanylyltransferase